MQEEIAKEVSEKLHLRPTGEEQKRLTKRYTENPEAHQLYLKGRYYWSRRTGETLKRAAESIRLAKIVQLVRKDLVLNRPGELGRLERSPGALAKRDGSSG